MTWLDILNKESFLIYETTYNQLLNLNISTFRNHIIYNRVFSIAVLSIFLRVSITNALITTMILHKKLKLNEFSLAGPRHCKRRGRAEHFMKGIIFSFLDFWPSHEKFISFIFFLIFSDSLFPAVMSSNSEE